MNNDIKSSVDDLIQFNEATGLAVGAHESEKVINLLQLKPNGFFSVIVTTASGSAAVLRLQHELSFDGVNFFVPRDKDGNDVDDIVTQHAVGTQIYALTPIIAPYMKLKATIADFDTTSVVIEVCAQ